MQHDTIIKYKIAKQLRLVTRLIYYREHNRKNSGKMIKLEYLVVYGHASMGVPVGELQSTLARTMDCDWSATGPPTNFFCHGQKRDYLSRALQARSMRQARLKTKIN